LLRALVAGMAGTIQAIRSERSDAVIVHVEAAEAVDSAESHLVASWHRNREQQFLPTELLLGRVTANHPLATWLRLNGMGDSDLTWFGDQRQTIDIMGVNFYPAVSAYDLIPRPGRPQRRRRRGTGRDVEEILTSFHARFGVPVMVTETAGEGTVLDRIRWMDESVEAVKRSREQGIPVVGYTWWPLFSMIHWSYRNGKRRRGAYWIPMALYDIVEHADDALRRERTDAADHYRRIIGSSVERIGDVSLQPADVRIRRRERC
jgi:beta-glucosidase